MIGKILGGAGTGGGKRNFYSGLIENDWIQEEGIITIFPDRWQAVEGTNNTGDTCFFDFFSHLKALLNPVKDGFYLFFLNKFNGLEDILIGMNRENHRQFTFNHR